MRKAFTIAVLLLGSLVPLCFTQAGENQQKKLWFALREAAARRGAILPEAIHPEDMRTSAPESIYHSGAPIEVRAISFDPVLQQLRFRFRPAGNSGAPWFSAWCKASAQPAIASMHSTSRPMPATETAVSTRRLATLHLRSENSLATLQVRPLEPGALGQSIRVRIPSNGRTLRAQITGNDLLEAKF
jgi:hypothetical protein